MTTLLQRAATLLALAVIGAPATAQTARDERQANDTAAAIDRMLNPSATSPAKGTATPPPPGTNGERCTSDALIHAEVSARVTKEVRRLVTPTEKGSALRDAARLYLPCGFHLDARVDGNLVLTDGKTFRRYAENNAFGFAPAFGFGDAVTRSYTLSSQPVAETSLRPADCAATLARYGATLDHCAGFGSTTAFFATNPAGRNTALAHYTLGGDRLAKDFDLATVAGIVVGLSFIAPPDAPGGTVTLLIEDRGALYRAYVDTPRG